ncbi:hypothetical protein JQ636_38510 [Bradyrhizobium japonicum]|uniref:hypothetical protein n=1 Tax=Bradyrhizobium japonicum TaxID=375 RepID=UPI001BA7700E|nr:hypothetical protein [Bradyrhizobium japonicum]MBR0734981.1 hypothetical protein [Bradyrhizobium japonicum]MBR0809455.1 hypothetical protein [Bradyrhizobium japonicum]
MAKPAWLADYAGGDTSKSHALNLARTKDYINSIKQNGRGLPADPSRPGEVAWKLVSEESDVKLSSLNRNHSECRKLILQAKAAGFPIQVRTKPRVRPTYTLEEAINISVAVVQAVSESAREDHRQKSRQVDTLLRRIARDCDKGLCSDSIKAISAALQQQIFSGTDATLLVEVLGILRRATRGELELHSFHGRLKLESALAGYSLSAVAKVTKATNETVINWAAGIKAPTLSFKSEIPKMENALRLPEGYLSDVYLSNRSGGSNIKQHYLPEEIRALPPEKQKQFRRLIETDLDLSQLGEEERGQLMAEKLALFHGGPDTIDKKRARLRAPDMRYGLKELPSRLRQEFDELVAERTNVKARDNVADKMRGWDANTIGIYYRRFCLFFGWMHHVLGVPLKNLSIAYLGFDQVLREYEIYLLNRKLDVGMEYRWASSAAEWYVFASSLTRRELGTDFKLDDSEGCAGWLRDHRELIGRLAPIAGPRAADKVAVQKSKRGKARPILTAAELSAAKRDWDKRLDETTRRYRNLRLTIKNQVTAPDSIRRVLPILFFENPLRAIEHGVWELRQTISELRPGRFHWCTAIRESVAIKIHAQLPLRRQTFCALTYRRDNTGMVYQKRGQWWVQIPTHLFKNERSQEFQQLTVDGFYVAILEDIWGLYTDLETYIHEARDGVLSGAKSDAFYVTRHNSGHVGPATFANLFRTFTATYLAENPGRKTGLQGVNSFGSHAMRHIVASAVFKRTQSLAAAAAAIHDSLKITEKHYMKFLVDPKKRADVMRTVLGEEPGSPTWPKFGEILPRIASPSIAPDTPEIAIAGENRKGSS